MAYDRDVPSRYELNRLVRTVLTAHSIDLQELSVSCSTAIVYLTGSLKRNTERQTELNGDQVEALLQDLRRLPNVRGIHCELDNWTISNADGSWKAAPKKVRVRQPIRLPKDEYAPP